MTKRKTKTKTYEVSFTRTLVTKQTVNISIDGVRSRAEAIRGAMQLAKDPEEVFWTVNSTKKLRGKPKIHFAEAENAE